MRLAGCARNPLRRSCVSNARNVGESAIGRVRAQPSAKCRRECDRPGARATFSSARNVGESAICRLPTQPSAEIVRVECAKCRRECDLSGARATLCGDRACRGREMQARVRFVRCARNPLRRSCVSRARNAGESAICRLRAQPSTEIVRVECAKCRRECDVPGVRATLWRLCSTTLVRGVIYGAVS